MRKSLAFALPLILCFFVMWLAGRLQTVGLTDWYPTLQKSPLTPPNVVFPIVWSVLYLCIAITAGLLLLTPERGGRLLMRLWSIQLVVNFCWSIFFFWFENPLAGLADIILLDALVLLFILKAWRFHRVAALLMLPYLLWILFATYLNAYIFFANP
ncbi:MAG: TspO/MBR family protein [Alistipes sp.]